MLEHNVSNETLEWSLTEEEIKSFRGFENISAEDIDIISNTFALLGQAIYESGIINN